MKLPHNGSNAQPVSRILSATLQAGQDGRSSSVWDGGCPSPRSAYPYHKRGPRLVLENRILLGLSPHEVYLVTSVTRNADRCLPCHFTPHLCAGAPSAGLLSVARAVNRKSWHAWVRSCLPVRKRDALWCSDFPPAKCGR